MSDDILRALPVRLREQRFFLEKEKRNLEPGYEARAALLGAAQEILGALERAISYASTDVEGASLPPTPEEINVWWRELQLGTAGKTWPGRFG
jgi:hypothetical protein